MSMVNKAIDEIGKKQDEVSKKIMASLQMLVALSESKKENMENSMKERMKSALVNNEIPPGSALLTQNSVHVMASSGPADGIDQGLSLLFERAEENWKKALSNMVKTVLDTVLGNASGSSSQEDTYLIALDGKAAIPGKQEESFVPVRIDLSVWTYDLKSFGVVDEAQNAIVYVAKKSLINYKDLDRSTVDQMLKNIGMEKALREDLIKQIEDDKKAHEETNNNVDSIVPKNIKAYNMLYKSLQEAPHGF